MMRELLTRRSTLIAGLCAAAVLVYLNSLANGFALDDVPIIQQNTRVHNLSALRDIWFTPYWPTLGVQLGLWRPLAIFLYAVQWSIGGGEAWVFHATNLLLHAGVTVLGFLLLERLTATVPAFFGALVFAVHPVHTEAVANIVGQAELIGAAAIIGACLVHAARAAGVAVSWPRRIALVALFGLGILAKENTVVLPALLVLVDFAQRRVSLDATGLRRYALALATPMLLLAASLVLYLTFRFDVLGGTLTGVDAGPSLPFLREEYRVLNALRAFPEFMRLLIFPLDLSADYSPGVVLPVETLTPMTAVGAVLLAGLVILALLTPWLPGLGFPAAWFLIAIITVSNLFFPIGVLIAERTLYLPSFAVAAMIAYVWFNGLPRASVAMQRTAPALLVVAVVAMGVRTWVRNPDWDSTISVLRSVVRDHPESYRAQWVMATHAFWAGDVETAAQRYELANRIYPRDSQFQMEYANFLITQGEIERALELLEDAYAAHPYVTRITALLAYAYLEVGRYQEALDMARNAEALGGQRTTTLPIQAGAYAGLGEHGKAVAVWRVAATSAGPEAWRAWSFLARTLATAGRQDEALDAVARARDFAADSATQNAVAAVEAAVRAGCYTSPASPAAGSGADATRPACDPLGPWFRLNLPAQNANPLQNAMPAAVAAPVDARADGT